MKNKTKKVLATTGGIAIGAAVGGTAALLIGNKVFAEPPVQVPPAAPVDAGYEGDDGDLMADGEDDDHMSPENIFMTSASQPVADSVSPDFVPQV